MLTSSWGVSVCTWGKGKKYSTHFSFFNQTQDYISGPPNQGGAYNCYYNHSQDPFEICQFQPLIILWVLLLSISECIGLNPGDICIEFYLESQAYDLEVKLQNMWLLCIKREMSGRNWYYFHKTDQCLKGLLSGRVLLHKDVNVQRAFVISFQWGTVHLFS